MTMPFNFTGKKVLITGAGRGVGRELAKAIAEAGGHVYALGRTRENIESLVQECSGIHPVVVDLSDWDTTREVLNTLDAMDGIVNNARVIQPLIDSLDVPRHGLEESLNVHLMAPINVIQATAKKMIASGIHGSIVNVSSVSSLGAFNRKLYYTMAKAGLDMVTKQFALELGPHQIRVNSVNPAFVLTEKTKVYLEKNPGIENRTTNITPMGRHCEVQEVIDPIMYLLSEHASMVSGTIQVIDGGLLCNIPV